MSEKHKTSGEKREEVKMGGLHFRFLPGFARFLINEKLREFISGQYRLMLKMDFPVLTKAGLDGIDEEQIVEMSVPSHKTFLLHVVQNTLSDYLRETLTKWKDDRHPHIKRDQLLTEDITLSLYVRKLSMLELIPAYTRDPELQLELVKEMERYSLEAETLSFNTFIEIHNHRLRAMNRQVEKSARLLLEAQELANLGSFEWDMSGRKKPVFTPQVFQIFEKDRITKPEELLRAVHPLDREKIYKLANALQKGRREFECEFRYTANGHEKIIWTRGVLQTKTNRRQVVMGTVMDVTARHKMLRKLQRNEELYKQAERLAHLGNWTYDIKTAEIRWSDELYRICNMTPQSKKITTRIFMDLIHPADRSMIRRQMKRMLFDREPDYRLRIQLPGNVKKHLSGKSEILRDADGQAYKIIGTCQDITKEVEMTEQLRLREENLASLNASLEQKNIELQRTNDELTSFNYVASHDLQEPLRKIKTFSDLVLTREKPRLSETGGTWLERISAAAGRMQKLIQDLLAFSRTQLIDDSHSSVNLNESLDCIKSLYENEISDGKLRIISDPLPVVTGVPFQLQQLFENLVSNSVKYHKDGKPVTVRIRCGRSEVLRSSDKAEKSFIKISFSDDGIGFEQKYAEKIFEIFQRLHGQLSYSGTGIGLAICKKIVENHGGFMRGSGRPGKGAVFDIYLPESRLVKSVE